MILNDSFLCLPPEIVNYEFDTKNLVCLVISSLVGVWYLLKKVSLTHTVLNPAGPRNHSLLSWRHIYPVLL